MTARISSDSSGECAVIAAVKKLPQRNSRRYSPPCITARRGGRAIKKISRSIRRSPRSASAPARSLKRGRGGFPMRTKGKPPRLRQLRWLREILLDDADTPPCGDARRGIALDSNFSQLL